MREAELLAILDMGPLPHAFMTPRQRRAVQHGVDALIDYLDAVTPDADLEPMDEDYDDLDAPGEGELDLADWEPSLGAPERSPCVGSWSGVERFSDQTRWGLGGRDDREDEHDGREPDVDDEEGFDRECDPAEAGIGDMDGLCEQVQQYDGRLPWSNGGYVA